jgi:hypothetical protein
MSRFHAPEGSVTEQSVRMAHAYEYMVSIETAWELERALNKAREDCHRLRKERQAVDRAFHELHKTVIGGAK